MIHRTHALSLTRQAAALGLSRGSVYYVPRPVRAADLALMRQLDPLHAEPLLSAATLLLAAGEHPKGVQERLGHASITLTLDTYSHLQPDTQKRATDRIDDLLTLPVGRSATTQKSPSATTQGLKATDSCRKLTLTFGKAM